MKYKRGLSIFLTAALVLTTGLFSSYAETDSAAASANTATASTNTTDNTFTDISGHWAESIIKEAASLNIVGGYPDGTFLPDNLIKREEFHSHSCHPNQLPVSPSLQPSPPPVC